MAHRSQLTAVGVCFAATLAVMGCATWRESSHQRKQLLPRPKLSPQSVVLEAILVRFPKAEDARLEQIWSGVEEPLSIDSRRKLEHNGFWCGVCGVQLPAELRDKLDEPQSDLPDEEGVLPTKGQRLQCRRGVRKPWVCRPSQPELNVLIRDDDSLRGQTYLQARCLMAIRTYPHGDGSVDVQLTPEIEHGETKPRHYGDGGLWQVRVGQELESFASMAARLTITPGQTVMVSCSPDKKGLGGRFFSDSESRSVLLLRLAQTQLDNLFAPDQAVAPITTTRAE